MKKILLSIGSLHGGGAERVVSVWASALAEKGYDVSVLVYSRLDNEYQISEKVKVYTIASSEKECAELSMIKRLLRFRSTLKQIMPDVVINFLPTVQVYVYLASIGLGIKRIETIRINPWISDVLKIKFKKIWLSCFKTCNALILQSEDQKPFFSKKVQKKSVVIPNPINPIYIENSKNDYELKSYKIVATGRLVEQKNYKMMIDAVKLVSKEYGDVTLEIYGQGNLEKKLSDYIKEQGLDDKVFLMGRSNELYKVYQKADLYLMTSNYEGMPNALMEAMAVGLVCISTDCKTGPRDLIDDGENGYLIPCGDEKILAEKIKHIFTLSTEERKALGQNAKNKITNYCGEENSLGRLIDLIENI